MERTISVKGVGEVSAAPDLVQLLMSLEARDKNYEKMMEKASGQTKQVKDALAEKGFDKKDIKTTRFNVGTEYDHVHDDKGNYNKVFKGYLAEHSLILRFDLDMEKLSEALSAITSCKAQPRFSIAFTVKDPETVKDGLLRELTANARHKAEVLCEASGMKLGKLLSVEYDWENRKLYSATAYNTMEDCVQEGAMPRVMSAKAVSIEPEDIKLKDSAGFVWEIF